MFICSLYTLHFENNQTLVTKQLPQEVPTQVTPTIVELARGQPWTGVAAEVVEAAGRRAVPGPLVAPAVPRLGVKYRIICDFSILQGVYP